MHFASNATDLSHETARSLDLRERVNAALAVSTIDREESTDAAPHPEAIAKALAINSTIEGDRGPGLIPPVAINRPPDPRHASRSSAEGPVLDRDRAAVLEIARYRLLPFSHLKEFVFPTRHASVLTRRMQALEHAGFITTWDECLKSGGHPRYALLTQTGLAWAIKVLRAGAMGQPHERLVRFMLRTRTPKPLVLAPRTAPPFLQHQVETNRLAARFAHTPAMGMTWSSAWHRPFPNHVHGVAMPQPDAVLIGTSGGEPRMFFLEHDRAQESPGSFAARKTQRYQLLLDLDLSRELLGFEQFTVLVTVADPVNHRPLERIRALQEVSAASSMMRFTPAGWAYARPAAEVWFASDTPVRSSSLRPEEHAGLLSPFSNLGAVVSTAAPR